MSEFRKFLDENYENLILLDPSEKFDKCILGICRRYSHDDCIAYDGDLVIKKNMEDGMSYDEAIEFFEYNQLGAYMGESTPVFIFKGAEEFPKE